MVTKEATQSEGDVTQSEDVQDQQTTVSQKEYQKVLLDAKKYRARSQNTEKELVDLQQTVLQEKGKYKELYEQETKAREEMTKSFEKNKANFAFRVVTSQVQAEAAKLGCIDSEALIQLAPIQDLEVDEETYNVSQESVKNLLENMQKTKPYLFKKDAPKIKDGVPTEGKSYGFAEEIKLAKTQKDLEKVMSKYNKI